MAAPGARMLKMVVMKLTAPRIEAVPTSSRATIHRSMPMELPCAPTPSDSGAYWGPAGVGRPAQQVVEQHHPGQRQHPERQGVDRGKAMSRAPICSGTTVPELRRSG